jgi:hypothetical protein
MLMNIEGEKATKLVMIQNSLREINTIFKYIQSLMRRRGVSICSLYKSGYPRELTPWLL